MNGKLERRRRRREERRARRCAGTDAAPADPTLRIEMNIASSCKAYGADKLRRLASEAGQVPVYSTIAEREIGRTLGYRMQGNNLWAMVEIERSEAHNGARCAAVIGELPCGQLMLSGVLLTNLTRGEMAMLVAPLRGPGRYGVN